MNLNRIRLFLKKRKIPKDLKEKRWIYAPDGITKIPVDTKKEDKEYFAVRDRLKKLEKKFEKKDV